MRSGLQGLPEVLEQVGRVLDAHRQPDQAVADADPKDLIASMRGHEAEVMRLLGEIEALVNEVQA